MMTRSILKHSAFAFILLISGNLLAQDTLLNKNVQNAKIITSQMKEIKVLASEEDKLVVAKAVSNLEFDFDKATIRSESYPGLQVLADWLKARDFTLKVSGHADYIGDDDYNLILSNKRALAVKDYLVQKGANSSLIDPIGFGESKPVASNETDDGRQKNRRVEFTLY
jgi:outer membrane protein OmpA-like peptidoglycan-associated protein